MRFLYFKVLPCSNYSFHERITPSMLESLPSMSFHDRITPSMLESLLPCSNHTNNSFHARITPFHVSNHSFHARITPFMLESRLLFYFKRDNLNDWIPLHVFDAVQSSNNAGMCSCIQHTYTNTHIHITFAHILRLLLDALSVS